jgi:hypothetical protein
MKTKNLLVGTLSVTLLGALNLSPAAAAEIVFCVNKTTRVVTFPSYGVCTSNQIPLKVNSSSNSSPTIKDHTSTAQTDPKSAQKVFVPNVLGMDQKQAQKVLSDLNLRVQIKAINKSGKVIQVLPKTGTQVAPGSIVSLVIG